VQRGGRRIIAVILGSPERKLRDIVTTQLIERGFAALPAVATPAAAASLAGPAAADDAAAPRLIPVGPEAPKPSTGQDAPPEATVHLDIPGTKK
jgi:D-alanyl-D-alanine carboxypeptidase